MIEMNRSKSLPSLLLNALSLEVITDLGSGLRQ